MNAHGELELVPISAASAAAAAAAAATAVWVCYGKIRLYLLCVLVNSEVGLTVGGHNETS